MKLPAALLILLLPSCFLEPQTARDSAPKQPPLATLTAHVDKAVYKGGEQIQVTLTLPDPSIAGRVLHSGRREEPEWGRTPA